MEYALLYRWGWLDGMMLRRCLYKRGSDQYVILGRCLYDTKKDADGYRKEYWGKMTALWIVLDDAIERYNEIVRNILKSGEEYVAKQRARAVSLDSTRQWCIYNKP